MAVAAGVSDNIALRADGTVWVWPVGADTPRQVTTLNGSLAIAAGELGLALKSDGTVWEFSSRSTPRQVPGLAGVMALSAAPEHNLALASDGTVWAWGHNTCGQLGNGMTGGYAGPVRVKGLSDVVAVSAGGPGEIMTDWFDGHSVALKSDGTVWEWGCRLEGGWSTPHPEPWQVLPQAVAIAAGGQHSLALKEDGTVWAWGWDGWGELGLRLPSGELAELTGVVAIAAGNLYSLAVKGDGTVWAWGINTSGQLGDGSAVLNRSTPAQVSGLPPLLPDRLVLHAASRRLGAVAPGEIVSINGIGLGSSAAKMAMPNNAGMFEKALGETTVLFDGVPAPVLFARTDQVNVAVPYAVAGKATTRMQTAWCGVKSMAQILTVADSAPGIFTADSSGSGQGAILNEDLGANSASTPAARGSRVTLFATGEGQTAPTGVDGQVSSGSLARPLLPVRVEIGGQDATVVGAAAAPGFIAGVLQVKVRIPETVAPGPGVPITLVVGTVRSPDGVTVAIAPASASVVPNPAAVRSIAPTAAPGDPSHGYPFFATPVDLQRYGFIEEEFLFEGTANRYATPAVATGSVIDGGHTYRTRMIVRRPMPPAKFNGTVLMEWQNVAGGYDLDALWAASSEHILRRGYAWVGVSAQRAGIHQAITGLREWSPARYGTLDVTQGGAIMDDALSFDIFSQAAQAVRNPGSVKPLGDLTPERIIAIGVSASANRLATYYNSIQPLTRVFDAFVLVSGGGTLRTDMDVKVFKLLSETEIAGNQAALRQPDTNHHRRWEVAGSAHLDYRESQALAPMQRRDLPPSAPPVCDQPPSSRIPWAYVLNAAYDHMARWVKDNVPPPTAPEIQVQALGPPVVVARDNLGNALGGIRLSQHAVPTAMNTGVNSGPGFCRLFGTFQPFDEARLAGLYPDHVTYLRQVIDATVDSLKSGFIVPEDAAATIHEAWLSDIGKR
ncbi:MAG: alpha/beta hydrolase domain-containing protein [Bryobacteraceae bacterium]